MESKGVTVKWLDPSTCAGWVSPKDLPNLRDMRVVTKGYLIMVNEEEETITVASTISEECDDPEADVLNPITIPRWAIQEIVYDEDEE